MSFLFPAFLWGLFALSIPVVIHLFNFQKPKEVLFTNVKFLKQVQSATSSRLKIKHWLILLTRLLFFAFLVFAFSQPVINADNKEFTASNSEVAIYLDNSYSMENLVEDNKALDQGLSFIESFDQIFSPTTSYLFLTNDFDSKDLVSRNYDKLNERITEISYSPVYRTLESIFEREASLLKDKTESKSYSFVFSDFQKSTVGDINSLNIDSSFNYVLVPIQNDKVANVFVDSVWLEEPLVRVNTNILLKTRVKNTGLNEITGLDLKLYLNDVQVSNTVVNLSPGQSITGQFSFSVNDTLAKTGLIRVEDQPVTFDNDYYFVLNVSSRVKIYHIYQGDPGPVQTVYLNNQLFDLTSTNSGQVDYSAIPKSDLVILNEINQINDRLLESLNIFLRQGGTVALFPGDSPDIDKYSKLLQTASINKENPDTSDYYSFKVSNPDLNNPFFKGVFEKEEKNMSLPFAFPNIKSSVEGTPILKLKNGKSLLSQFNLAGGGKFYLFNSPLKEKYTNFHKHGLFVPVMYKMAFSSYKATADLAHTFQDKNIEIEVGENDPTSVFSLEGNGVKLIPAQRLIDNNLFIEIPDKSIQPGFFELKGNDFSKVIALNAGNAESEMEFYSSEELKILFEGSKNVQVLEADDFEDFYKTFKNQNIGTPLWKYCLILALIFLLTEIALIRFL